MKIKYFIFGIGVSAGFWAASLPAHAAVNLIANPSVETISTSTGLPIGWQTDNWGTNNATFTYKNTGYNSGHSIYAAMTGYKSGDAKWYFNPVSASSSATYTFTDHYKSNVATHIVAMSLDASGAPTYFDVEVNVPAASSSWATYTGTFKTPSNTKKITILHLLENNGWLQTDDFSLSAVQSIPITDLVPNNSVEVPSSASSSVPADWYTDGWGTNTPQFQYITNDGHDGSRSVKITMTGYSSGDAKWVFDPQALTPGKDYRFTAWYKTNTIPHVVAEYEMNDGSQSFFGLPDPLPPTNSATVWQKYSDVFPVPASGVRSVTVYFFLTNNGWLQTDDYHITPYTYVGFNRGLLTLTFDNGFEDNVTTALPILDKYGFKVTYCYSTEYVEGQPGQIADVKKIASDGNETCSHSVHHSDMTLESTSTMDYELSHSKQYLASTTGQTVNDFLTPFGAYNSTVLNEIKKYYQAHRTTDEGFNSKDNYDTFRLRVQNMAPSTTLAQFEAWVNKAKTDKTWLIIVYHQIVATGTLQDFDTKKPDFDAQMQWLASSTMPVLTMQNAIKEIRMQLQ
jgi:peptidoglycan/xylan/chitin deacetylase (PgdA/CDA1 family)